MPEYLLSETTVCAHVQTSIKYDYDLLSLYANFITCIVQLSDCKRIWIVVNGFVRTQWTWTWAAHLNEGNEGFTLVLLLLLLSRLLLCCVSKDICNAKADLDSPHLDGHKSPFTSSSWPLISACFLSSNEQTHPAALKRTGKYLTNWSRISWSPKRDVNGWESFGSYRQPLWNCFTP